MTFLNNFFIKMAGIRYVDTIRQRNNVDAKVQDTFRSLKSELITSRELYTDDNFPASATSLYSGGIPSHVGHVVWKRPTVSFVN